MSNLIDFDHSREPKVCCVCHQKVEYWKGIKIYDNYWDKDDLLYICDDCLETLKNVINEKKWINERR